MHGRSVRVNPAVLGPAAPLHYKGGMLVAVVHAERSTRVIRLDTLDDLSARRPAVQAQAPVAVPPSTDNAAASASASQAGGSSTGTAHDPSAADKTALSTRPNLSVQVSLAGLGISVVSAAPQELLYLTIGDTRVFFSDSDAQTVAQASVVRWDPSALGWSRGERSMDRRPPLPPL